MTTPRLAPPAGFADQRTRERKALEGAEPRPQGVWWARVSAALGSRICWEMGHPVTTGMNTRPVVGKPGETEAVAVWCCAVCWEGTPLPPVPPQELQKGKR
jgi:hypothetical protein